VTNESGRVGWAVVLAAGLIVAALSRPGLAGAGINSWTISGPHAAGVISLAIDPTTPTTLYTASDRVFKTTDGGASWTPTALNLCACWLLLIGPVTPTTLYAAGSGLFKTTGRLPAPGCRASR
jgi:hypothetical protein